MTSLLNFSKTRLRCAIVALGVILAVFTTANISRWSAGKEANARSLLLIQDLFIAEKSSSLMLYAHADLFSRTSELDWPSYVYTLRRGLGRLTSIDTLSSTLATPLFNLNGGESKANITVQASFETGPADIQISYLRSGGEWLVTEFLILADALSS